MEYQVLNHNNAVCTVTDADIEEAAKSGEPLPRAIVLGMGKTHDEKYLEYMYPVLYHEVNYMRLDAAQGIINLNGRKGLEALKEKERSIDPSAFDEFPSEKAVLMAMIIRIEEGPEGILRYFRSEEGLDIVKYCLLSYYSSGYDYKEEDIRLISVMLSEFVDKKLKRVKKVTREDWIEFVYFALDSLWVAALETEILAQMTDEASQELVDVFREILEYKATNDIKELMADISKSMKRDYALEVLRNLKGKTGGGNARSAYKKALKHF
ncbi:MAG: hypothetical protein K2G02_10710, partial [Phocaeicola sp.]|nr:hypothetical protein [Phocaeicola sp.]